MAPADADSSENTYLRLSTPALVFWNARSGAEDGLAVDGVLLRRTVRPSTRILLEAWCEQFADPFREQRKGLKIDH